MGSRGPGRAFPRSVAAAKAWLAAEVPHALAGIEARLPSCFVLSLARLAALFAEAFLSGLERGRGLLVLAQPNEAAALAAASFFLRPREGYEGKSLGSAYLMRPPKFPR